MNICLDQLNTLEKQNKIIIEAISRFCIVLAIAIRDPAHPPPPSGAAYDKGLVSLLGFGGPDLRHSDVLQHQRAFEWPLEILIQVVSPY
jgi:hypothetical protein